MTISQSLTRSPRVGPPGPGFFLRLRKSNWTDADRTVWAIHEMTTAHLWAVLGYVRWYTPEIAIEITDFGVLKPKTLITRQPVWLSIAGELVSRGEIKNRAAAWSKLQEAGDTPWERDARLARRNRPR